MDLKIIEDTKDYWLVEKIDEKGNPHTQCIIKPHEWFRILCNEANSRNLTPEQLARKIGMYEKFKEFFI